MKFHVAYIHYWLHYDGITRISHFYLGKIESESLKNSKKQIGAGGITQKYLEFMKKQKYKRNDISNVQFKRKQNIRVKGYTEIKLKVVA